MHPDYEQMLHILKGDQDALQLALDFKCISHIWDDLIDLDKAVTREQINQAFWLALVSIPSNAFYQRFSHALQPVIATTILNWHAANALESGPQHAREIAHVIRYSAADLMILMALLLGGPEWAVQYAPAIRLMCQKDTLANFLSEMENKHAQ